MELRYQVAAQVLNIGAYEPGDMFDLWDFAGDQQRKANGAEGGADVEGDNERPGAVIVGLSVGHCRPG